MKNNQDIQHLQWEIKTDEYTNITKVIDEKTNKQTYVQTDSMIERKQAKKKKDIKQEHTEDTEWIFREKKKKQREIDRIKEKERERGRERERDREREKQHTHAHTNTHRKIRLLQNTDTRQKERKTYFVDFLLSGSQNIYADEMACCLVFN